MIDKARLEKATTLALQPHLGVAAEFVAQDAIALMQTAKSDSTLNDQARERIFFIGLGGMLDKTIPFEQIRAHIFKVYRNSR